MNSKKLVNLYTGKGNFGLEERLGTLPSTISKYIEYTPLKTDVGIFLDYDGVLDNMEGQVRNSNHKYKVFIQMEPATFNQALHYWIRDNENLFDLIFVHYTSLNGYDLSECNPKYRYYSGIGKTFIPEVFREIHQKTKNISAIWSSKNYMPGHILRGVAKTYINANMPSIVDFNNPPQIYEKINGLKDYRFEIVIENEFPEFLTEKPIDSMLCGCIPIIWGNGDSREWDGFNKDGMIFFKTKEELFDLLKNGNLNEEYYDSKIAAIQHNFSEAHKHLSFGDIIWNSGLSDLLYKDDTTQTIDADGYTITDKITLNPIPNTLTVNVNLLCGGTHSQIETLIKVFAHNPSLFEKIKNATAVRIELSENFKNRLAKRHEGVKIPDTFNSILDQHQSRSSEVLNLTDASAAMFEGEKDITPNQRHLLPSTNLFTNDFDKKLLPRLREVSDKLFNWKSSLINDVNYHYKKWGFDSNTLGIHLRGTDMHHHSHQWGSCDINDYVDLITKALKENPNINKLFIASDSVKSIKFLKQLNNLPPIYSFDISRLDDNGKNQLKMQINCENNIHEVLRDTHMLSRLPILIGRVSSLTNIAIILNKNLKKYYCLNEYVNDHAVLEQMRRKFLEKCTAGPGHHTNNNPPGYGYEVSITKEEVEEFVKVRND